jgi:peptide/nickel transport system permease protein
MTLTDLQESVREPVAAGPIEGRSTLAIVWSRLRRDRVAVASAFVILAVVVLAAAAPLIANLVGWGPTDQDRVAGITSAGLPVGPSAQHLLGTDNLGRDILVRTVYGARISLLVGVGATALATLFGVIVGLVAGYHGGAVDTLLARFMDVVLSFPFLLFAIALVSIVGPSLKISVIVIAFFSWAGIGRVVRGQTLSLGGKEFVEAARSLGAGDLRIMVVDILPNLVAPVLVLGTLLVPIAIVFEATLSFLGLGVVPPTPSWGNMISDALPFYSVAWWFVAVPGAALLTVTLAFNLLGDGVRDALDPGTERLLAASRRKDRRHRTEATT